MKRSRQYWFRAKKYGWGWGLPLVWQGWAVAIVWLAMMVVGAIRLLPMHPIAFLFFTPIMGGVITLICYITGEPPKWRWGDREP
jgi:hypothetical protein